jgi:hypothetical protein
MLMPAGRMRRESSGSDREKAIRHYIILQCFLNYFYDVLKILAPGIVLNTVQEQEALHYSRLA